MLYCMPLYEDSIMESLSDNFESKEVERRVVLPMGIYLQLAYRRLTCKLTLRREKGGKQSRNKNTKVHV